MTSRGRLWLTDAEERELRDRLHDVIRSYRGRTRDHPEDARPWNVYAMILPPDDSADERVPDLLGHAEVGRGVIRQPDTSTRSGDDV
jgi:hypothetical protein